MPNDTMQTADCPLSDILSRQSRLWPVAGEILSLACRGENASGYLDQTLPLILGQAAGDYGAVASPHEGRWSILGEAGAGRALPIELLAAALDGDSARAAGEWAAVPLGRRGSSAEALAVHCRTPEEAKKNLDALRALAPVLHAGLEAVRRREKDRRRLGRLEAILEIANSWNQTREVQTLLSQMAEAATRLLGADRASIFLWDRPNRLLVGRPALGAPDGELRIPDDRGVVGQVVQTGLPRRVDAAIEPELIDHRVDAQLQYETRTLVCVPLRGRTGELFGAFELINKRAGSFTQDDEDALLELAAHAGVALENAQDRQQLLSANRQIAAQAAEGIRLIGDCPAMTALRSIVRRVADTDLAVLILGENGTGKEVVAQSIHYLSRRRAQPFIAVNCAAIPDTLAESELFGHEKGSFTDAKEARPGKFELAAEGTLFLDEIGDLSLSSQAKLLRVLEEKVIVRVGGSRPIHTEARVVAATNQNLAEMVRAKKFREDLYFRLNVVSLELPPLRTRGEDILLLAEHFLSDFCRRARRRTPPISPTARKRLLEHAWPGNIRELRNLMERLAYLSAEDRIDVEDLAFILSPRGQTPLLADDRQSLAEATDRFQIEYIRRLVEQCRGNMSVAASRLGLHRSNLYRKMRQLGMEIPRAEREETYS
jgi:transcriptional regulator with GAF, ATPase, and Fis domain